MPDYAAEPVEAEPKPAKGSALSDDELLKQALAHFTEADDADREERELRRSDLKFALGNSDNLWQWDQQILAARKPAAGPHRPCITNNRLPVHIKQVTNDQRQNPTASKVRPVDDMGDPEVAEILGGVVRHIQDISDASAVVDTASDMQVAAGLGYFRIVTEYLPGKTFDQEIYWRRIPDPDNVRLDPFIKTPEGSDARYGFIFEDMPLEDFKRSYPKGQTSGWDEGRSIGWLTGTSIRVAEYFCIKHGPVQTISLMQDGTVMDGKQKDAVDARDFSEKEVWWYKMTAGEILERTQFESEYVPIIRVVGQEWKVDGKTITEGMTRNAKDPQRVVNYMTSCEAEFVGQQPKSPYVAAKGQIDGYEADWAQANTNPKAVLLYNPVGDPITGAFLPAPQRQMPPAMPAAYAASKLGAIDDLKAATGKFDASIGNRSNETSGIAIQRRNAEGDTSTFHFVSNRALAEKHATRITVGMIPRVYSTRQIARIIGEDGETKMVRLDMRKQAPAVQKMQNQKGGIDQIYNLGVGRYDVTVTIGPSYTTKRQESADFLADAMRADPSISQKAGDIIWKNFDVAGADQLSKRLKLFLPPAVLAAEAEGGDKDATIAQLTSQSQQMEQALQNADQIATNLQDEAKKLREENAKLRVANTNKAGEIEVKRDQIAADVGMNKEDNQTAILIKKLDERMHQIEQLMELARPDKPNGEMRGTAN